MLIKVNGSLYCKLISSQDNYANIQIGSINNGSQSDSSSVENSTVDASPAIIHDTTLKPSDSNDQFNEEYVEDTTAEV